MTTKSVVELYNNGFDNIEKEIMSNLNDYNVTHLKGVLVKDSMEGLIAFLERQGKTFTSKILGNLEILIKSDSDKYHYEKLKKRMKAQFGKASDHFFKDLFEDADETLIDNLYRFKLDKNKVFEDKIESIKEDYINGAIDRIEGEQNDLKSRFLQKLVDWTQNENQEKLDVRSLINEMKQTSVKEARFFARDTFSKFNKALLISSFKAAGVKTVKLRTVGDGAVRDSHRAWNNNVFHIDDIPQAWFDDYNCRCSAVPVEYYN
jgi:SPP1 gp7 family putative phage head morphogenesis protein